MLDTFKVQLKAKSTAAGANLSNARIDAIAAKLNAKFPDLPEEADHVAKIDDVYDAEIFKDLAAADDFQRAKEKRDAEKKKEVVKKDKDDKKEPEQGDPEESSTEKLLKELLGKVTKLESEKKQGTVKSLIKEKAKDVPEHFYDEWALPEEDAVDAFIEKVNTKYAAFKQDLVNQGLAIQTKPGGGNGGGKGDVMNKEQIKSLNDKLMPKN